LRDFCWNHLEPINIKTNAGFYILLDMKRSLAIIATVFTMGNASTVLALEGYKTAQNQLIVAGLKPGKLYGVIATTNKNGYGVKNFTANACGEVVLDQVAGFKSVMIDRKKLLIKDLVVKPATPCTKKLTPVAKPTKTPKPQR
jgi:hypothetical protein